MSSFSHTGCGADSKFWRTPQAREPCVLEGQARPVTIHSVEEEGLAGQGEPPQLAGSLLAAPWPQESPYTCLQQEPIQGPPTAEKQQ